jgi:hypothetical protein
MKWNAEFILKKGLSKSILAYMKYFSFRPQILLLYLCSLYAWCCSHHLGFIKEKTRNFKLLLEHSDEEQYLIGETDLGSRAFWLGDHGSPPHRPLFCSTGVWTQDLVFARLALYHLSHAPSPGSFLICAMLINHIVWWWKRWSDIICQVLSAGWHIDSAQ